MQAPETAEAAAPAVAVDPTLTRIGALWLRGRSWLNPPPDDPGASAWRRNAPLFALAALTVLLLGPFLTKAFNIDEPLFLWSAKHIQRHFFNPYGFKVNWYGSPSWMWEITKNPPLVSYYLAVAAFVLGWSEAAMHLALLPVAVGAIVGTYLIAQRYCQHPFVAGLCTLLTPAFMVSSATVMCDTMMLAFWVVAAHLWLTGLDKGSRVRLATASLLIGLCALTKYFGCALIPLLLVSTFVTRRKVGTWLLYFIVPVAILVGYQYVTHRLYGRGLLFDAASFANTVKAQNGGWSLRNLLVGLTFTGGCVAVVLFFSRPLWSWPTLFAAAGGGLILALVISLTRAAGTHTLPLQGVPNWAISHQLALFALGGVAVLALTALDLLRRRDGDSLFLAMWVLGTWFFATFVNWTPNGRSILPLVPAVAILIVRRLETVTLPKPGLRFRHVWPALIGGAALSLLVTSADYRLARSAKLAAEVGWARQGSKARRAWFQGHWGFQYYMELAGAHAVDVSRLADLRPGDILGVPANNTNMHGLYNVALEEVLAMDVPSSSYVTTMLTRLGGGFFAEIWGPLPFAFGKVPPERYNFYVVVPPRKR